MDEPSGLAMRRWSTADVAPSEALDYYAAAVERSLVPMSVERTSRSGFHASVEASSFDVLDLLRMVGSAHRVARGEREIARSERHLYHLMINRLAPWQLVHLGRSQLLPGDAILTDSAHPHELTVGTYEFINITMTADFVERWLPDPLVLTGRRLDRAGRWTGPLAAFAAQMTPDFAVGRCPLPDEVITNQLGSLLRLAAQAIDPALVSAARHDTELHVRIVEYLQARLPDATMTASNVAESLGLEASHLHDILAAHGETFAALLLRLRIRDAEQLRASSRGRELTLDELARSAGFRDGAQLAAAMRNRAGVL